jgi:ferredoxin-thioredoxin reductase catalytic chain
MNETLNNLPQNLQAIQKFSETYAQRTGTFFCSDLSITSVVI